MRTHLCCGLGIKHVQRLPIFDYSCLLSCLLSPSALSSFRSTSARLFRLSRPVLLRLSVRPTLSANCFAPPVVRRTSRSIISLNHPLTLLVRRIISVVCSSRPPHPFAFFPDQPGLKVFCCAARSLTVQIRCLFSSLTPHALARHRFSSSSHLSSNSLP